MHDSLMEVLVRERIAAMDAFAARRSLRRAARAPRPPLRVALGLGLIRAGQFLLRGVPARTAEPRSPA